jgi:uncharacterized membrane protein YdjX (TVP38/TMEM64 family)
VHAISERILESQQFFQGLGWLGVLAYAGVIVLAQMVCLPLSPLAVAGGLVFGLGGGFAAISIGTGVGAVVNFLLSRYTARAAVQRWLGHHEKFKLIDAAIGREGWKIVALLRFCPIPYGIANYSYGLTAVRFLPYWIATLFAIIPGNFFFSWFGASSNDALAAVSGAGQATPPGKMIFTIVGLVAFFCALTYVTKIARAAVARGSAEP